MSTPPSPPRHPSRRMLLAGGLACGGVAVGGGLYVVAAGGADACVRDIVERRFPGLQTASAQIAAFAADLASDSAFQTRHDKAFLAIRVGGPAAMADALRAAAPSRAAELLDNFKRDVVTLFAQSTNVLTADADPVADLAYFGLYDPYRRPCGNPLATAPG